MTNKLVLLIAIWICAQSSAQAYDAANATYNQQLRAYHEKLLAYKVQPGRFQAQRTDVCEKLKELTRQNQNVDALWAKFDALERRANGKDAAYADDCNAFIKEVLEQVNKKVVAENVRVSEAYSKSKAQAKALNDAAIAGMMKSYAPHSGYQYNRRKRIWEQMQSFHARKADISNQVKQLMEADTALGTGSLQNLDSLLTNLEDSLNLPHNIKD